MIHTKVLPEHSYKLLIEIQKDQNFSNFYLAGGTSLALQIGHRESIDLDFFTATQFESNIISSITRDKQVLSLNKNSVELIVDDTKLFFFYFAFPLLRPTKLINSVRYADPIDIGLMKLLALQGRSTKKDIIDLYFIHTQVMPLADLLQIFEQHYPKESFNSYSSFKKLLNLSYIESQPTPKMFGKFDWDSAKDLVVDELTRHIRSLID